jgi:flagellar assembly protein FliH
METVIQPNKINGHVIQKYHFKVLSSSSLLEKDHLAPKHDNRVEKPHEAPSPSVVQQKPDPIHNEMLEQMLKKTEELSAHLLRVQEQLEKQEEVFEKRLQEERQRAFQEGELAGRQASSEELNMQIEALRKRLTDTIGALQESQQLFMKKVDTIEEELIETALDLAKQVIVKEIQSDSQEIALRLAKLLLTEVKEAASITLKVNPDDFDYIQANLETRSNLKIVADPAVGSGGVIVLSDIGNIDGEIMHRFERIKEAVFGTVK